MNQDEAVATERESGTGEQHGSVTVSVNGWTPTGSMPLIALKIKR